ncbi:MAG: GNAT family N-acetyltransferase [bacterium]
MATAEETKHEVQHDEDNGKFFIPFSDKQAVLRYTQEDGEIEFRSIFVPPSLREDGLEKKIVLKAYEYAEEAELDATPATAEEFFDDNQDHV